MALDYTAIDLSAAQSTAIAERLAEYDRKHTGRPLTGEVGIGMVHKGKLIAGAEGCLTVYRIFYISTVFVEEAYRGQGVGRMLMAHMEKRAAALGANLIRLDTFDWQGVGFYQKLGYTQVGSYTHEEDHFSEYFFIKKIN